MNRIKKYGSAMLVTMALLFTVSSCDLTKLDINNDPNNPAQASLSLLLTNVELNASATFAGNLNDAAHGFMALTDFFDSFNMSNNSWNGTWNYLYSNPLKDLDGILTTTAQQRTDGAANPHYEGIAKVLKAYYFSLMVDLWGDVPYSEAFKGDAAEQNLAPSFDGGADIYGNLITLIDEAIAHFAETSPVAVAGDLIYGGSAAKWTAAAKSLKYKLLLQMSAQTDGTKLPSNFPSQTDVVNAISALESAGGFISAATEDFQFTFSTTNNPDDRHPMYQDGYAGGTAAYSYFGHQLMYEMLVPLTLGGTVPGDPRTFFYFKRQTKAVLNPDDPTDKQTIPCSQRTDCTYGYFPLSDYVAGGVYNKTAASLTNSQKEFLAGYFGRDRSDPSGIPNDNPIRTTVGLYPAAGLYDDGPEAGGGNKGKGDGIFPMITSWMTKVHRIEAALRMGVATTATPRTLFEQAMNEQFAKVNSFVGKDPGAVAIDLVMGGAAPLDKDAGYNYIQAQLAKYDAASTNSAKLNVVLKQAWFMNFGNGFEIYNTFRRTGLPSGLQTPLQPPRQFALRLPYAQDEINLNPTNTPTVVFDSPANAVFWDALKFQF